MVTYYIWLSSKLFQIKIVLISQLKKLWVPIICRHGANFQFSVCFLDISVWFNNNNKLVKCHVAGYNEFVLISTSGIVLSG